MTGEAEAERIEEINGEEVDHREFEEDRIIMELQETFKAVHPSIVALGSRFVMAPANDPPSFPWIIGTGFIVDSRGIVATNKHVAEELLNLPHDPETNAPAAFALVYSCIRDDEEYTTINLNFVEIRYIALPNSFTPPAGGYFGEPIPDLAFMQLEVTDVPALSLVKSPNSLLVGMSVATAGFPLGTPPLTPYGYVSQVTPFLRKGIVSSVQPFPCAFPHGFTLDIMLQGGSSGSPVFMENSPEVVGIVHGHCENGPNITFALPSKVIAEGLSTCLETMPFDFSDLPTLQSLVNQPGLADKLDFQRRLPVLRW